MVEQYLQLNATPPFKFAHTLAFLRRFKASGATRTVGETGFKQVLVTAGVPVFSEVRQSDYDGLSVTLSSRGGLDSTGLIAAADRLHFYLGLDDALESFYEIAGEDDAFRPVLESLYGYHLVKFPSPFEAACWTLITQRTPNPFAFKTMRGLSEALGYAMTIKGVRYSAFPEPNQLLESPAEVLEITNNTRKTERVLACAEAFLSADETFLRQAPYEEVRAWLETIHGLGRWSSEYVLLRGLGRSERLPWNDTWLVEAVSRVYTPGLSISRGDIRKLAEVYGWQQGYWLHYLKVYAERLSS